MTREELVENDILIPLELGEKIVNKKIIKVPKPDDKNYWNWDGENWVYDNDKEKTEYFAKIDEIKAKSLAYGFDYKVNGQEHRQRCRDKDIAYMVANVVALQTSKTLGMNKKTTWYFEDNFGVEMDLMGLGTLMLFGTTFVQSVFDTENHFKKEIAPKKITEQEFEIKRKEIHNELVKGLPTPRVPPQRQPFPRCLPGCRTTQHPPTAPTPSRPPSSSMTPPSWTAGWTSMRWTPMTGKRSCSTPWARTNPP